ncbi:MAG TPA: hypothetical protein VNL92_01860 [Dehalococcoidia bacterium]|nr:hypothetical protein [Dehalococcoidia bacterium]
MPCGRGRGDDEVVRKRGDSTDIEQDDVLGLAVREPVDDLTCYLSALQ